MAVEAGYSKIATSGSVFIYDTGDTINSYIGEPTTNLAPYSQDFSQWGGNLFGNWINSAVTLNASYAPDGTLTGNRFGNGYSRFTNSITATTSTIYTFSVWLKNVSLTGAGVQLWYAFGLNGVLVSYVNALSVGIGTLTNQWQRFTFTVTSPSSGINQMQFGVATFTGYGNNPSGEQVDVWGGQVEQKSHMTQYLPTTTTSATRSNTQGLLDISGGGNSINLANMSYDANAQPVFDGTDDYTVTGNMPAMSNWTAETVVNLTTYTTAQKIILDINLGIRLETNNGRFNSHFGNGSSWIYTNLPSSFTYTAGKYYHVVVTVQSGGSAIMYINGIQDNSTSIGSGTTPTIPMYIGRFTGAGGYEITGYVPVVKIYNRALSASEVLSNYNHYKTRFNIT